jgi:putative aldouronate transport system substrate-binding protein
VTLLNNGNPVPQYNKKAFFIAMKRLLAIFQIAFVLSAMSACQATEPAASTAVERASTEEAMPPVTLTCFINHPWYAVDSFTGYIPEQITKDTGVTLDLIIATDSQQLGVMIASGLTTDLVYTDTQLDKLSNANLCYAYDDLIAQYGLDWDISPRSLRISLLYSHDGKAYCIRNHYPETNEWKNSEFGVPMLPSMLMRKDMLTNLGNPSLTSLDDLSKIFDNVKSEYPNIIPLVFDAYWRFGCFRIWTGVTMLDWIAQADGTYQYYIRTQAYKNMLKMLNGWYRKGYMVSDNFVAEGQDNSNWYSAGRAFATTSCTQNSNVSNDIMLKAIDPTYESTEVMPLGLTDYAVSDIGWSGTFITRKCTSPEAAIRFMRYMFTPYAQKLCQMGREGIDYTIDETTGIPVFSKDWMASIANYTNNKIYNPWIYLGGSEQVEAIARCSSLQSYEKDYDKIYDAIRSGYSNHPWISAAEPIVDIEEKTIMDKIKDLTNPFEAKIVLSDSDSVFEANYGEFLETADDCGLSYLESYMNKRIPVMELQFR